MNRSVKYLNDDDKAWIDKQMKLEGEMFTDMDKEAVEMGYNEVEKFTGGGSIWSRNPPSLKLRWAKRMRMILKN
ncbi:MAG: hypothetical protein R2764_01345 [Bacteroidales bacterium]